MTGLRALPITRRSAGDVLPSRAAVIMLAVALAACSPGTRPDTDGETTVAAEVPRPIAPPPRPAAPAPSQKELRQARVAAARTAALPSSDGGAVMRGYLQRVEDQLLARGLLRMQDGDPTLTPDQLAEDFVQIALRNEHPSLGAPSAGANATPAPLRRWPGEVRMQLAFGPSVPPEVQARDRQTVAAYAERLGQATRHPVRVVGSGGNFIIIVASDGDAAAMAPRLKAMMPGLPPADATALGRLAPQTFCTVFSYGAPGITGYAQAVALIRAELPPRLRLACFHEELAQGLGLPNDSDAAKPSIFNDDEAYAALTHHDELLLRILYDPRLRSGMEEAQVRPIARAIAAELLSAGDTLTPTPAPAPAAPLPDAVPVADARP